MFNYYDSACELLETLEDWAIILFDSDADKQFTDEVNYLIHALENMDDSALDEAEDFIINNADYVATLEAALVN